LYFFKPFPLKIWLRALEASKIRMNGYVTANREKLLRFLVVGSWLLVLGWWDFLRVKKNNTGFLNEWLS